MTKFLASLTKIFYFPINPIDPSSKPFHRKKNLLLAMSKGEATKTALVSNLILRFVIRMIKDHYYVLHQERSFL